MTSSWCNNGVSDFFFFFFFFKNSFFALIDVSWYGTCVKQKKNISFEIFPILPLFDRKQNNVSAVS